MYKIPRIITACVTLLVMGAGCSAQKTQKKTMATTPRTYFIHGDPMQMIARTQATRQSFFNPDDMAPYSNFNLKSVIIIKRRTSQAEVAPVSSQNDLENINSTSTSGEIVEEKPYNFSQVADAFRYSTGTAGEDDFPYLDFRMRDGLLDLRSISGQRVEPIHYSMAATGDAFSLLASFREDEETNLIALTFVKKYEGNELALTTTTEPFEYLRGTSIPIGWKKPLTIALCGPMSRTEEEDIRTAITSWSTATGGRLGKIAALDYNIVTIPLPKPFTDLNENCISLVRGYRLEDQLQYVTEGVTLSIMGSTEREIIDAHVFLFVDAIERSGTPLTSVATHEVGHVLGLGHEFKRDLTGSIIHPSIMGYDSVLAITDWDKDAVFALYPLENEEEDEVDLGRPINFSNR